MTIARLRMNRRRDGLILVVVLVMVVLLALLAASYTFMVQAHVRAAYTDQQQFQARMAAESGIQRAIVMLRTAKNNPAMWYDNPALFRGAIVHTQSQDAVQTTAPEADVYNPDAPPTWRFNLVAPNDDNPNTLRYGITDECSKLNLNSATETQLRRFLEVALPRDTDHAVDLDVLVESLLDWREPGDQSRPNGAKSDYYLSLRPPYQCKGGPFTTVEELLLVKGFTGWVMYGEDANRNGLLDPNEDDGDKSFPPDNSDGSLFRGIARSLTLWSLESNTSSDGRPKINLNMKDAQELQAALEAEFRPEITSYVIAVRSAGVTFNSVMNLLPAPPPDEEEESGQDDDHPASQPSTTRPSGLDSTSQPAEGISDEGRVDSADQNPSASEKKGPVFKDLPGPPPPGNYDDLPLILDRLTVNPAPFLTGRINVNTAPLPVLAAIEELTPEEVQAIVAARATLRPEERTTAAWMLTRNAIREYRFRQIFERITTRSSVFEIESVGFADHLGVVARLNVILEMRGPMPQVILRRDLSSLEPAYRPHGLEQRGVTEQVR